MVDDNTTPLIATWIDPSPGCEVSPAWFRWSIGEESAPGLLTTSEGPKVNFSAGAEIGGTVMVLVRSAASIACGLRTMLTVATAESIITVVAPVTILNLSLNPNPVLPGGTSILSGNVTGGRPPYTLRATWGDRDSSSNVLNASGAFELSHAFPTGDYQPELSVSDSDGLFAHAKLPNSLDVSPALSVGLVASRSETDIEVPVRLNGSVLGAPAGSNTDWSCPANASGPATPDVSSTWFVCSFPKPGLANASFTVFPSGGLAPATALFPISVEPLPRIAVTPSNVTAEVGQPLSIGVNVSGGVPPFRLTWSETGSPQGGALDAVADGLVILTLRPTAPGQFGIEVRLGDSDGVASSNTSTSILVDPALNVTTSPGRLLNGSGAVLDLTGTITAGVPPFLWIVGPSVPPVNGSNPSGVLSTIGPFDWWGTFRTSGQMNLTVTVVDAVGGLMIASYRLDAVDPFVASISIQGPSSKLPESFIVALDFTGGVPPFALWVNATNGESWNRSVSSDGDNTWEFSSFQSGVLGLEIVVMDGLGASFETNATINVPANSSNVPSPPSEGAAVSFGIGIVAIAVFGGLGAVLYRRRRTRVEPPAPLDPVAVLRKIIEPADGADRATVEILAEEAGIPLEVARSTIDRLIAAGTIRRDGAADGEEVISWATLSPP